MATTIDDLVAEVCNVRPDMEAVGVSRASIEAAVRDLRDRRYEADSRETAVRHITATLEGRTDGIDNVAGDWQVMDTVKLSAPGLEVLMWIADDRRPVVQIDTDDSIGDPPVMRVYVNDGKVYDPEDELIDRDRQGGSSLAPKVHNDLDTTHDQLRNWRGDPARKCWSCGSENTEFVDNTTRHCRDCGNDYALEKAR